MKRILLSSLIFLSVLSASAQSCEVKLNSIKGNYTGDCENNKASGTGKSVGEDEYEGAFKNGYPEGKGMYVWKDGHYFVGSFKKGLKDGKGEMFYEAADGKDSTIPGFWKKDKYVGEFENSCEVLFSSSRIGRIDCRMIDSTKSTISVSVQQISSQGDPRANLVPVITGETILTGTYQRRYVQKTASQSITQYQEVMFPFRIILTSGTESAELIFHEQGSYSVGINLIE